MFPKATLHLLDKYSYLALEVGLNPEIAGVDPPIKITAL
jgi:hypothetical protein